jgi:ATP-dependent DNA helicase RecG
VKPDILQTPLNEFSWLTPQRLRQLEAFGMLTAGDLLFHYPRRYEDRRQFDRFPAEESDHAVCVCGTVVKATLKRLPGWKKLFEVTLTEDQAHALSPVLTCRWFNLHFVQKMIATGQRLVVYGKPKTRGSRVYIDHPEFEVIDSEDEILVHVNRITPIYRATEGLPQRVLRAIIFHLVEWMQEREIERALPDQLDITPFATALRDIHFPDDWPELERARRRLVIEEFFVVQLCVASKRAEALARNGRSHRGAGTLLSRFHAQLPFGLTRAQKQAIEEIAADMASPHPMNRLLQGDVGSGKTVVAVSAMLLAVEAGSQAALMAPTQVLAEQHYMNFCRWLEPLGLRVMLRTGARQEESSLPLFDSRMHADDRDTAGPHVIVGTHALLYEGVEFSGLGLVVIDEQHKFGVMQRARLMDQVIAPDVLVMTATPIPRTLTMTVYGDLEVSILDEMPANRGKILTAARDSSKLPEIVAFIRKQLTQGRQAYIIYTLIDESDKLDVKAATAEFEKWTRLLQPMSCDLLHGRMDPAEKDRVMRRFRDGKTKALIATSVIEVGIDVPNANVMLVENAERFGLAQLHQLRGRIGRGEHTSYCILISGSENEDAREKLQTLESTSNGFEIAEADLRLRGPGDILGTAQSGLPPLKLGNIVSDAELMKLARQVATRIFVEDPDLIRPENACWREWIARERRVVLAQVS